MTNWKIEPENRDVQKYIDCYWFIEKTEDDLSPDFPKLNPDPAGHLIIADKQQPYQYKNEILSEYGKGSHLILPNSKTITVNHSQPFRMIGIKFQFGALYTQKITTDQNLLDQIIPINSSTFFRSEFSMETDLFKMLNDSHKSLRNFLDEQFMLILSDKHEDKHSELVRSILQVNPQIKLSNIGSELGYSQRTIERSFLRVTGLTLKQYYTMERLESLLTRVHTLDEKDIRWADIAQEFGFSDQPHLVRYLKSSIGNTPGEYAKNRDLTIDAYGNFD